MVLIINTKLNMKGFRLPRKTKKILKKTLWLYPTGEDGNSIMAFPTKSFDDYTAMKQGIVRPFPDKKNSRARRKEFRDKINKEIFVPDNQLKAYVDGIIRKELRVSSYNILLEAKRKPQAQKAYFNFVNAYQLYEKGEDSYGNICCLAVDWAKNLLKKSV